MKIVSWNVNGLRAVYKRNFLDWFKDLDADIICLQEIKIQEKDLLSELKKIEGYHAFFNFAQKKGYAGVAIYSKIKPISVEEKIGLRQFDKEGRYLKLTFENFEVANFYLPHGGHQKEKLNYKLQSYQKIFKTIQNQKNLILAGDFNVAHKEIDLARPRENQNNIMFTPVERTQIDRLISLGFVDSFRKFNKKKGYYTWWPYRFDARARNLGWRIDYIFVSSDLKARLYDAKILSEVLGSDHCPIEANIKR